MRREELFNPNKSPMMVNLNKDRLKYIHQRDKELIVSTGLSELITLYNNLIMAKLEAIEVMVRYKERYNTFKAKDKMYKDIKEANDADPRLADLQTARIRLAGELKRLNYGLQANLTEYYSFLRPFNDILYGLPEKHLYDFTKGIIPACEYRIQPDDLVKHLLPEGAGIDCGTERWDRTIFLDEDITYRKGKKLKPVLRQKKRVNIVRERNINNMFAKVTGIKIGRRGKK